MRLHSLILAAIAGVPAVAIDYHSKVKNFAESIGTLDWLVEITDSSPQSVERLVNRALSGEYPVAEVRARVNELRESAKNNPRIAAMLLQERKVRRNTLLRTARGVSVTVKRVMWRKGWQ
jgi:polysaccharide pyruvyl transferase WcaK-like protein